MNYWKSGLISLLAAGALLAQAPSGPPGPGRMRFGEAGGPWFGMGAGQQWRTPVTGQPYSAVQTVQIQQTLAGGNQIQRQEQSNVYRDSQGRVRTEHTFTPPGQAARTMITIFDPVAGYLYRLDPQSKTARQIRIPTGQAAANDNPRRRGNGANAANTQTENLGVQTINGLAATGTRITRTIPAGAIGNVQPISIVRETWVSQELQVPVMIKSSDPRFGTSVMQLTNISRAEPDPSLFQVPSAYTIKSGPGGRGMMRPNARQNR
ncbi:MAG TPA: hypothetical protein VFA33_00700 [Bryobacteraceae bacterium]|nr:hypothetical protein [Bryobacteraceae bacterium]